MMPVVPQAMPDSGSNGTSSELGLALASLLECLGASAGWIALCEGGGGVTFPACRGALAENWLRLQQPQAGVWGVALGDGPLLLNDLQPWATLGDPPLRNFLSCPLVRGNQILGHVALANKPQGFSVQDAAALQAMAHHTVRSLERPLSPVQLPVLCRHLLERTAEGILVLDHCGELVYVNPTWLNWTGFSGEELLGRHAPFPFWVGPGEWARALSETDSASSGALPFRRRDQSLLWCQVEIEKEQCAGRPMTVAFLRQSSAKEAAPAAKPPPIPVVDSVSTEPSEAGGKPVPNWLPLLLEIGGSVEGWGPPWEELTGLSAHDVAGSRSDLVLDWLFPHQHDRERVADCFHQSTPTRCQLALDITTPGGSRSMVCTFCPLPEADSTVPRRWLLLVGEPG